MVLLPPIVNDISFISNSLVGLWDDGKKEEGVVDVMGSKRVCCDVASMSGRCCGCLSFLDGAESGFMIVLYFCEYRLGLLAVYLYLLSYFRYCPVRLGWCKSRERCRYLIDG